MSTKTIVLLSQKGGAGKSTLAVQLAVLATQRDHLACIIDIDAQGSAALWRSFREDRAKLPLVQRALPERLSEMIKTAGSLGVTVVLIDTPGLTDNAAVEAIRVADIILAPTKPDLLNLGALKDTIDLLELANSKSKSLAIVNDLPTAAKARAASLEMAMAALTKFGIPVADQTISHSQPMVDALNEGKGITEKSPKSNSAKEIAALWEEIERRSANAQIREAAQ